MRGPVFAQRWFWTVWAGCLAVLITLELQRLKLLLSHSAGVARWIFYWDSETTAPTVVLLVLPLLVLHRRYRDQRRRRGRKRRPAPTAAAQPKSRASVIAGAIFLFGLSLGSSWFVGTREVDISIIPGAGTERFMNLPPSYHDEYSYLLQAQTFSAGRLSWPAAPIRPDLFHQFHVLNERRTVSRYFPLTGIWIAFTRPLGNPYWGHWLAGALSTVFFFLTLRRIADFRVAILGGTLIAVSPGLAVFSNMLLAHHPTMLALSVFAWSFLVFVDRPGATSALLAGTALTLAMLGRPMTAAGFGLPFGLWLVTAIIRGRVSRTLLPAFAIPLLAGFGVLAIMNQAATGSLFRSAYQHYTDTYTPRHRYGFYNGTERTPVDLPEALQAYDRWAENLTPSRAAENVGHRLVASLQWSLSVFPIAFFALVGLSLGKASAGVLHAEGRRGWGLLMAAIASLHAVHVPYWYRGIMDWHYVFETAPLVLMLTACGVGQALVLLPRWVRRRGAWTWCAALLLAGLFPGWFSGGPFAEPAKVDAAVSQLSFSRVRFNYFNLLVDGPRIQKPALILVEEAGTDPQLSFIINEPGYDADVLVCRAPQDPEQLRILADYFSQRSLYTFDPQLKRYPIFQRIDRPIGDADADAEKAAEGGSDQSADAIRPENQSLLNRQ